MQLVQRGSQLRPFFCMTLRQQSRKALRRVWATGTFMDRRRCPGRHVDVLDAVGEQDVGTEFPDLAAHRGMSTRIAVFQNVPDPLLPDRTAGLPVVPVDVECGNPVHVEPLVGLADILVPHRHDTQFMSLAHKHARDKKRRNGRAAFKMWGECPAGHEDTHQSVRGPLVQGRPCVADREIARGSSAQPGPDHSPGHGP